MSADRTVEPIEYFEPQPIRAGWGIKLYSLTWVILGVGAAGFMATSVEWPTVHDRVVADLGIERPDKTLVRRLRREIAGLKQQRARQNRKIASLSDELAAAKRQLAARPMIPSASRKAADARTPGDGPGSAQGAAPLKRPSLADNAADAALANTAGDANATASAQAQTAASNGRVLSASEAPPLPFRITARERSRAQAEIARNPARPAPITTGSVRRGPKPDGRPPTSASGLGAGGFGETVVVSAAPRQQPQAEATRGSVVGDVLGVRLSSAPSLDSLRFSWQVLRERHGSVLEGLQPRYRVIEGGANGPIYQLVAGPVTRVQADALCDAMRNRREPCSRDSLPGQTL